MAKTDRAALVARLKLLLSKRDESLSWHHQVGRLVGLIHPTGDRKYAQNAMQELERDLGEGSLSAGLLLKLRQFANSFSEATIKKLESRPAGAWKPKLSLLIPLFGLPPDQQEEILNQCVKHRWTTRQMRLAVRERFGKRGGGGRPHQVGGSLKVTLAGMVDQLEAWRRQCAAWLGEESPLTSTTSPSRNPAVRELAEGAAELLAEVQRDVRELGKRVRRVVG